MQITDCFSQDWLDQVSATLTSVTSVAKPNLTRSEAVKVLGLTPGSTKAEKQVFKAMQEVLTAAIKSGAVPGFALRPGINGGVVRLNVASSGDKSVKKTYRPKVTDDFAAKLLAALDEMCDHDGNCVPRENIAAHLDNEKCMPQISEAIRSGKVPGFAMKPGATGGAYRLPVEEETESENVDTDVEVSVESDETVEATV